MAKGISGPGGFRAGRNLFCHSAPSARSFIASLLLTSALVPAAALAGDALPGGGTFTAGSGTISSDGTRMEVRQSSGAGIVDWNGFSIGSDNQVHFENGSGATLNRVTGNVSSQIDGALTATGSVFLINPAGVVVGSGGMVATGGSFVASTHDVTDADFLDGGSLIFSGTSEAEVVNAGTIRSQQGDIALIARRVENSGTLEAPNGTAGLAAGYKVLMKDSTDADGLLSVQLGGEDTEAVNSGTIAAANAEIRANGGNVYALAGNTEGVIKATGVTSSGGRIFLTAGAAGKVKVTGRLKARTLPKTAPVPTPRPATEGGHVTVSGGDISISGTIDASAETSGTKGGTVTAIASSGMSFSGAIEAKGGAGGSGGFVETSGESISIADTARVTTLSGGGEAGTWLIDPNDLTIAASGGDITGETLSTNLAGGNVTLSSNDGATDGSGDIFVNDAISWTADTTLTLNAVRNVEINDTITATGTNAGLALTYGGGYSFANGGRITLSGDSANLSLNGNAYALIHDVNDLQAISGSGLYALAETIDASGTTSWNSGAGFNPISGFSGTLAGLGNTIESLTINRPGEATVGMFSSTSGGFRDFTLSNVSIVSGGSVGALAYRFNAGQGASNIHVTGTITSLGGGGQVGGLVGWSDQTAISNSSSTATVTGFGEVGGLVGRLRAASITNSYATGAVTGTTDYVGGLVGSTSQGGMLTNVYASGNVTGTTNVGGLVGGAILAGAVTATNAYWDVDSTGQSTSFAGTGIGNANAFTQSTYSGFDFTNTWVLIDGETRPMLQSEYSTTIFTPHQLQLMALDLGADYMLGADLDMTGAFAANSGGYYGGVWSSAGFDPVGINSANPFTGGLDGQGHTISGLKIDRSGEMNVGLLGYADNATVSDLTLSGGSIAGGQLVGALAGEFNGGTITSVSSNISVAGSEFVGGLVGASQNFTAISLASASGDVSGSGDTVGGLIGALFEGTLSQSYATGNVSGSSLVGGLVGANGYASGGGTIDQSFATGNVTGAGYGLGGLVGSNEGAISNAYAMGNVTSTGASSATGGFVGVVLSSASIENAYATGKVTGAAPVGGFAGSSGADASAIKSAYWNTETSGQASGIVAGGGDITGLTTAGLQGVLPSGFSNAVWGTGTDLYPYFNWLYPTGASAVSGFAYSDAGTTALTGAEIGIVSGGSFLGGTGTGANGYYYYLALPGALYASGALAFLDGEAMQGAALGDSVTSTGVTGLDIYGSSLNLVTNEAALSDTVANLTTALGSYTDSDLAFIDTSATQLTASGQGLYLDAASDYTLDQDLTAGGLLSLTSGGTFTIDADRTLKTTDAGSILVNSGVTWNGTGTLTLNAADNIALNGAIDGQNGGLTLSASGNGSSDIVGTISTGAAGTVDIGTFTLNRGAWEQIGATLPSFSVDDFRLVATYSDATFIRTRGGDGSIGDPYQLFDLYGLQGMTVQDTRTNDYADYGVNYQLVSDIDASGTVNWNGGAGFYPVNLAGDLDGNGHTIDGLFINRPGDLHAGLIGSWGDRGGGSADPEPIIKDLNLTNANVTGGSRTGILFGFANGSIVPHHLSNISVSGTVTGSDAVGGIAGFMYGQGGASTATGLQADVTVTATSAYGYAGGLFGQTLEGLQISRSRTSGTITGSFAGGLAGEAYDNNTVIETSSSSATVTSAGTTPYNRAAGGLVGHGGSLTIRQSYFSGQVLGSNGAIIGGIVGDTDYDNHLFETYVSGLVKGTGYAGALIGNVGSNYVTVENSVWDIDTTGQSDAFGAEPFSPTLTRVGSRTTAEMQGTLDFGLGFSFDNTVWGTGTGLYPYFGWQYATTPTAITGTAYSDAGTTALAGADVSAISGGSLLGSATTGANGYYYILAPSGSVNASGAFAYLDGESTQAAAFKDTVSATGVTGLDIYGSSLNLLTGETALSATIAKLDTAIGSYTDTDIDFIDTSATQLTASGEGVYVNAASSYTLDQDLTAGGLLSLTSGGTFTIDADRTLKTTNAGSILLNSGVAWNGTGTLTLNSDDDIALNGAIDGKNGGLTLRANGTGGSDDVGTISTGSDGTVDVGTFNLPKGYWYQVGASLPSFEALDFRTNHYNASFVRAQGGDGSVADPYQLFDVYGLQGITGLDTLGNQPSGNNGRSYQLVADIDATGTSEWNGGVGFAPVFLAGSLDGGGHTIDGLYVYKPNDNAGLIGTWDNQLESGSAVSVEIKDLSLTNAHVVAAGNYEAGILFGHSQSYAGTLTLANIYVSGTVSGGSSYRVGGVGGYYSSAESRTATNIRADVDVSGGANSEAGGLFGYVEAGLNLTDSSFTGTVSGQRVGGLIGYTYDDGSITNSWASATVTSVGDDSNLGGLVGRLDSNFSISGSWFSGSVLGTDSNAKVGGLVGLASGNVGISNAFTSGSTTASGDSGIAGGLVGLADGLHVSDSYASGSTVASGGSGIAGGLIGWADRASVTTSYASGLVDGALSGGLVGQSAYIYFNLTDSVWDREASGQSVAVGDLGVGTVSNVDGVTSAEMKQLSTFVDHGFDVDDEGGTGAAWRIYEGNTAPLLRSFMTGLTVTGGNSTKTYDGSATSADVGTLVYGSPYDSALIFGTAGYLAANADAGVYTGADLSLSGLYSSQFGYDLTLVSGSLAITPKALTVSVDADSKIYDGTTVATGSFGSLSGLIGGDVVNVSGSASFAFSDKNVGTSKTVTVTGIGLTGADAGNYTIASTATSSADITPATLWVAANAASMTYGDGAPTLGYTYGGLVGGDDASVLTGALSSNATSTSNVGSYGISQGSLSAGGNYQIAFTGADVTVNRRAVTVQADDLQRTINEANPALTYNIVSGTLVNGDQLSGSLWTPADANSPAGAYDIDQGSLVLSANYDLTYLGGVLTVLDEPGVPTPTVRPQTFESSPPLPVEAGDGTTDTCEPVIVRESGPITVHPCNRSYGAWLSAAVE
ncbi:filamentous hemagglutinin family N-terminal domain-containing protein [Nitratireductor indicus]|nr:MBG domain-containing protein [Nitratireductor indicus]SFQ58017.1 filamentous hemagglutinin family N-terminal domain-containing protein [Nitratireductor indicus]